MASLPSYLAAVRPVPPENRAPWYKTVMPTYAGIILWYVFWQGIVNAGTTKGGHPCGVLAEGLNTALFGVIIAALICHFLFYLAPASLGMRTGLPLYVVGTSTYGARGGRYMPGFLMGLLQFGWLAVNACFASEVLCMCFGIGLQTNAAGALVVAEPGVAHGVIAAVFAVAAAFVGLKGIRYVARVATYLPLVPLAILIFLLVITAGGLKDPHLFERLCQDAPKGVVAINPDLPTLTSWEIIGALCVYVVGFFATAGAAGADIASNCRNADDVHIGGITGILLPIVLVGEITMLIVAGAYGSDMIQKANIGNYNPVDLMRDIFTAKYGAGAGPQIANFALAALAIASFPAACFPAFIAANSFKTTLPKVNSVVSVGIGTLAAVALAVSGWAGQVSQVFAVIGASFGPVCGAMLADYLMSGRRWVGPRAGFNPAGWISWIVGFAVGGFNLVVEMMLKCDCDWVAKTLPNLADYRGYVPVPPVAAFVVGFVLYVALSAIGLRTRKLLTPDGRLVD
jgi:cytosine permease